MENKYPNPEAVTKSVNEYIEGMDKTIANIQKDKPAQPKNPIELVNLMNRYAN